MCVCGEVWVCVCGGGVNCEEVCVGGLGVEVFGEVWGWLQLLSTEASEPAQ